MKICIIILSLIMVSAVIAETGNYQYISPKPGSLLNSRETNIILRPGDIIDRSSLNPSLIEVFGASSGAHRGDILLSDDDRTIIFNPGHKFYPNEKVTVSLRPGIKTKSGEDILPVSFTFVITPLEKPIRPDFSEYYPTDRPSEKYSNTATAMNINIPANSDVLPPDFPEFIITGTGETAPGLLFGGNSSVVDTIGSYSMIIDNSGTPLYFEPNFGGGFDLQPNGLISYNIALGPRHQYKYWIKNQNYSVIDSFQMGNGYIADSHDFLVLPNGHAIMLAYDIQPVDMSLIVEGGQPNAEVTGSVIQELDVDKNVVYQWRCWDYIPITDSYKDITRPRFDYIHVNSVELDKFDGNIILSCRETWEAIKISRETGEVLWRLGGKNNEFTFVNEHAENAPHYFKLQHSVRRLANGNLTIFDNGADKDNLERNYSRAVEYALDEENKTVTMVWEFRHNPDILALSGGTVQRLPNGNTLISWGGAIAGGAPAVTEVTLDGTIAFELSYTKTGIGGGFTRHPWYDSNAVKSVTHYEVLEGNEYDFNEGDSILTGTSIEINTFTGESYNDLTVTKTDYGPIYPKFVERAPVVIPSRVVITKNYITSINAIISFDTDIFGLKNPETVIIYHREFEGSGLFIPLSTSYNPITKRLSATMTKFGEFILGYPDFTSVAYAPKLLSPADSVFVNQTLPLAFRWAPVGYYHHFQIQVAEDSAFGDVFLNAENLNSDHFVLDSVAATTTYYWRVRTFNDAGESNWSPAYMFTTTSPNISITTPNGGEELQRGLRYFIEWEDNITEDVIIDLYKGSEFISNLDTTASSGSYRWSVDPYLPTGSGYAISIKSAVDTNLYDLSDRSFTIIDTVSTSVRDNNTAVVQKYNLFQNFPNPFNPTTQIKYALPVAGRVVIEVYNTPGQLVSRLVDSNLNAGIHEVAFNAVELPSGIYLYRIQAGGFYAVKKMVLIK